VVGDIGSCVLIGVSIRGDILSNNVLFPTRPGSTHGTGDRVGVLVGGGVMRKALRPDPANRGDRRQGPRR
jgi:hypothetical protein